MNDTDVKNELRDRGYIIGEDWIDIALNMGYRWNEDKKIWFHRDDEDFEIEELRPQ